MIWVDRSSAESRQAAKAGSWECFRDVWGPFKEAYTGYDIGYIGLRPHDPNHGE